MAKITVTYEHLKEAIADRKAMLREHRVSTSCLVARAIKDSIPEATYVRVSGTLGSLQYDGIQPTTYINGGDIMGELVDRFDEDFVEDLLFPIVFEIKEY